MTTKIKLESTEIEQENKELKLQDLKIEDEVILEDENKDTKEDNIEPKLEDKEKYLTLFKRFLHYCSEYPLYKPGDKFHHKHFSSSQINALIKLIALESPQDIINLIIKVKQDGTSAYPESLVFVLAFCAHYKEKEGLQAEAYKALRVLCPDTQSLFLFLKFTRELNQPHMLGGSGWKKAIGKWYLVWTPFDLSQILTKHRSYYGWTHKDVIRLAHVKGNTPQQQMLLTYALKGYKHTKKEYENSDDAFIKQTLKYLTEWKVFVTEEKMIDAAKKLETELYPLELIPARMLRDQDVWNTLLPRLEIKDLLKVMQRVAKLGFLRNNSLTVQIFTDSLDNYYSKQNCGLHPSEVFIELRKYETGPKICLDFAKKLNHPSSYEVPQKNPPKVNLNIVQALTSLYNDLFLMLKPTNKSYLIALDCRSKLAEVKCWHCRYLSAEEAAHVITKTISSAEAEDNVNVIGFDEKGNIFAIPLQKDTQLKNYPTLIKEMLQKDGGIPEVSKVINYATKRKLNIDMFVVLSDNSVKTGYAQATLENYRTEMKKEEAKLVTCTLTGKLKNHKEVEGEGMLCIYGFDNKVCRLIEAFARGAF